MSAEHPHRPLLGIALRLGAMLAFAVQLALVKRAGEAGASLAEIVFWRQMVAIPLLLAWMAAAGRLELLRSARYLIHGRRALLGLTSMSLTLGATLLLPLAELTTLTFTGPLFAVTLSALLLREHVGRYRWFAVALGFVGVMIVAQPGGQALAPLGVAMVSTAALLNGLITIQVRDLNRTEHPLTIVILFSCFSMPIMAPLAWLYATPHPGHVYLLLAAVGVCGLLVQLGLTGALRFGSVATVAVMDYSSLIWSTLLGWWLWDHLPPLATWLGAPLIVAAGLIVLWREHRLAIARAKELAA